MGYHQQYYGDKTIDPKQKYKSHGHFNRATYRFMTDKQFEDFLKIIKKRY